MGIPLLTTNSTLICPHGGQVILFTSNALAQVQGGYILLQTDVHPVVGCPFIVALKPQPCVTVRWNTGATMTKISGTPVLLQTSLGLCFSAEQIPQGPAVVLQTQPLVLGL